MIGFTLICTFLALLAWAHPAEAQQGRLSGGVPSPPCGAPGAPQINTLSSLGGSLVNGYGTWQFGPGMTPPTGAAPPGPWGTFNFVKLNGKVINRIGQTGIGAVRSGASQIVIDCGGNVFFLTLENDRQWVQYVNYDASSAGSPLIDPTAVTYVTGNPPNYSPPYTPSADGTTLTSTIGCVTTLEGVWCNGSGGATWQLFLNGLFMSAADPTSQFKSLAVNCNGNVFVSDWVTNNWAAVLSFNKYVTSSTTLPTCPIPTVVTATPNPTFVTSPVPGPQINSSTTVGSVIASVSVTTSDGSPFSGSLSLATNPSASFIGISGSNIVTTGIPTPAQAYNVEVHATSGGSAPLVAWPGASTIELIVH